MSKENKKRMVLIMAVGIFMFYRRQKNASKAYLI